MFQLETRRRRQLLSLACLLTSSSVLPLGCRKSEVEPSAEVSAATGPAGSAVTAKAPSEPSTPSASGFARKTPGEEHYQRYCKLCHGADANGYAADNAPSLISKTFLESASDQYLASAVRMGRPNTAMAAYGKERGGPLDEADIAAIVAFLRSKGPAPLTLLPAASSTGDAPRGALSFEKNCQRCHGSASVRGTAPRLQNPEFLSAASPEFIRYAIVNGRPPTAMPAFGTSLGEAEIEDLVAYLRSLAPTAPTKPVAKPEIPDDLPVVLHPRGAQATFELRDERFVPAADVKKALDEKRRLVIIDARSPADWIQFRIPGSIPLPYHGQNRYDRIPKDGTWVVAYCACPHHASGEVVDDLRRLGYPKTAVLDEGMLVWKDRGYPLAGEAAKPATPGATKPAAAAAPADKRK